MYDTNTNTNTNSNTYSHTNTNYNSNTHTYSHTHTNSNTNSHTTNSKPRIRIIHHNCRSCNCYNYFSPNYSFNTCFVVHRVWETTTAKSSQEKWSCSCSC